MKILIVCSTNFYDRVEKVKDELVSLGYEVTLPNGYGEIEVPYDSMSEKEYLEFFKSMYLESKSKIDKVDSILVLNYDKVKEDKVYHNYIGASTFLEMYEAFMNNKKIYLLNDLPDNMLYDEIKGFDPILLCGEVKNIKK